MGVEEVEAEAVVVGGERRVGGASRQLRKSPGGPLPLLVATAALALLGPETAAATTAASSSSSSSSAAAASTAPTLSPLAPFQFKTDSYFASIYENSLPRTYVVSEELIGIPLDAVPPGAYVVYSIENGDPDNFFTAEAEEVGGLSVLHVRTRTGAGDVLNRERRDRYNLNIVGQVRGHQGVRVSHLSAQTNLSIQVLDINDNMPLFYPNEYSVTAGEDASLHSTLVTVAALDADAGPNGEVYYSLENADTNNFAVHPTTGVVSLTRPLVFTRTSLHRLTILAKDRGPRRRNSRSSGAAKASVEVRVKQVNNHDPRIIVHHLPHIVEHAHTYIYAILTVHDDDKGPSGRVSKVEIVNGDPDRLFSITRGSTSTEFNLAVLRLLDRELAPKGYNLTLLATDDGIPKRTAHANVHVNIADVNDHAPVFAREQYEVFVSEEAPPNTPVVRVAALDTDQGPNGRVVFRLVAGNEAKRFSINAHTGLISTADWLDAETTAYYSLTVAALDQASNARRKQSSAKVVIRVSDANDNPPQFSTPNTEVTLDENEPVGSYVTRVVAADDDSGENGFISYSIANLDQVPFSIDPFDGTIKTTAILDYEAQRRIYTIKVRASDWGTPFKRETETTVKVKVRDVNDNRPQFEGIDCAGWVSLDAPVGTSVLTLSALDLDADSVVSYRLTGGHEDGCWALDATAGVLALTCDLKSTVGEGERPQPRIVNVTATDGLHTSDVTSVTLAIVAQRGGDVVSTGNQPFVNVECQDTGIRAKVAEVVAAATKNNEAVEHYALLPPRYGYNTHVPELSSTIPASIEIREDAPIGTELLTVAATDRDPGHNGRVVYAVAGGDVDSVFRIDVTTGVLQLWAPLDREKTAQYVLNISVYDLGVPHLSSSKNVTVRVLDVNDNPPEFTRVSYSLHLPENTRNGTSVAQLHAIDPDEGLNAQVTYELVTDAPEFLVDKKTGVLYVTGALDRERRAQYDLRVRAWDSAPDNHLTALAIVYISIIDMNDCAPDFGAARELMIGIPEDLPLGAVAATFHATDDDLGVGGKVTYSLTSGHEDTFRIDPETGVVRIAKALDYETRQVYNVTVRAQDGGHPVLFSHAHLLVQVHDVDENMSPPSFPERVLRAWVKENNPPGTYVTTLKARDPEGGPVSYTITGGEGLGLFSIDSEGVVRTLVSLDRELHRGYWISVTAADSAPVPLTDTCHVYIEVEDVNDHVPQTLQPAYYPTVEEDLPPTTTVVTLEARDGDLAPSNISFSITGGDAEGHFHIHPTSGLLSTAKPLDRETVSRYKLEVTVSDGELSSITPVIVTVADVNDNAPAFLEPLYRVSVPARRKSRKHDLLFTVFAMDADTGMNSDLDYSIQTRRGKGRFKIHPKTGQVYSNKSFMPGQTFNLVIQARDNGRPRKSATTRIIVRVSQVPDTSSHAPKVDPPTPTHVMETDPPGHFVTFIHASDPDNDTLWYYITEGDAGGRFSIGVDSGLVTVARPLDREARDRHTLTIEVTDGVQTEKVKLVIEVLDVNDQRPVFRSRVYRASIRESSKPGDVILGLHCRDKDDPLSASSSVYYTLHHAEGTSAKELFSLDSSTGELMVAQPLDRESASNHELTVSCRDRGGNENVDYARVVITVMDENDHDPIFLENMITAQLSESVAQGTAVTRLVAVDHDRGENGRLSYSVVEGNAGGAFSMDESLGILRVARALSRVEQSEYVLLVRATDHATQPRAASVPVRVILNAAPQSPPTWQPTGQGAKVVEVSEWSTVGSAVARVSATSSSSVYYDIREGNTDGAFTISPSSGVVRLAMPLDFEATESYNLTIASTNMAGVSAITWLAIRVLDENDWWPEWDLTSYQGVTLETSPVGTLVLAAHHTHTHARKALGIDTNAPTPLTVTASDRDSGRNGRVSYSIVEKTAAKYFSIDPHTGAMRVAGRLDEVAGKTVKLSVWANDGGDPRRECIVPAFVSIKVTRVNHSPPIFTRPNYKTKLLLPTFNGVRVLCVNATDPDRTRESEFSRSLGGSVASSGDSGDAGRGMTSQFTELEYSVTDGDSEEKFEIDTLSGCLTVKDQVNLKSKYNLTVKVSDGAFSSEAKVDISVEEAPQSSIVFTQEKYFANVLENSTKEVNVVVVSVRGTPLNHHIEFSILNPSDYFTIRPTAGVIKTTGLPFDRELQDHHTLVVQAREAERPEYVARVMVNVAVLDVNDNAPVFVNLPYHALVSTNSPRGHVVTKVRAVDGDSGDNGVIRYELVRGSGELFAVNKKTGEISLKQPLMVADKTYSLTVAAYDRGKPPLSSQAHVLLRVVDAEGPVFSAAHYLATAPESVARGAAVARVEAASPSGAPLIYTIVAGNTYEEFTLDYTTGVKAPDAKCVIKTAAPLDYETTHTHNLTLRARDPITGSHADAQLTLTLTDVNDNAPDFTAHVYNVTVSEAAAVGQKVAKVEASDRDTGLGGLVHYSCATACDLFSVGRQDGQVTLARTLDAERERRHVLTVVATDSGLPPMSSSATVIVHVSDFNDNAPVWSQRRYTCRVSPEAARGHLVTTLAAHDPDAQDTRALQYSIHSGDSQGVFSLDATNGLLSVVSPQKLKGIMSLNLNVSVTDGVHAAFTALNIAVASSNHNQPVFSKPLYDGRVMENSAPGQLVARVEAEDADTGVYGDFAYALLDVTLKDTFRIDKNGNIITQAPLDREDQSLFTVPVSVVDAGGRADFAQVRVVVEDANDNSPVFTLPSYQANVPVNVAPGTIILKVEAEDEDEGLNSEIVYRMYEADNSEALKLFKVHPKTGRVTLAATALGRETEVYQFFIRAEDKGTPSRNSDVPVTIFLLSSDDQPPHCSRPYGQFFLPEDAAIGTVVTSLWVDGPMPIKYALVAKDREEEETTMLEDLLDEEEDDGSVSSGPFTVTSSGLVSLRWPLDREKRRTHRLTVVNQTLTTPPVVDYMTIDVVVMDVNDCVPRFTSQNYRTSVAENDNVGSTILMLTANDDDEGSNGRVQYSITEDDPNIRSTFRVDPHTGAVTLVAPLDRETIPSYSFGVEATDGGATPLSSSAQVFIAVKDYNDNPPVFRKDTYVTAVPEDAAAGTVVVELEVDDEDELLMPLDFLVSGGDSSGHFLVHASGQVYVARSLDRETQAQYTLTVTATDGKFTANTTVVITVIDSNDNGPVCLEPMYRRPVSEGAAPGTHVATIAVWDADEADAARSRFSLTGEAASHFTIDQLNGQVATARRLDRETRDHYSLVVTVEDWEHPEWQCETRLEIGVGDVNDNSPEFVRSAYTATVPEDAPLNSIVTKVHATDPDLGVNRRVRYGMVDSAGGHFEVDAVEGVVSLIKPLDREHRDSYSLTLRASDQGQPALSSTVVLAVIVGDVNDNAPEFVHTLLNAVVAENTPPGTEVTRVLATSRDVGINAEITYTLLHDTEEEFLGVHPKTGVVSVTAPLDYERLQQVVVTVLATDGGTPPLSATALLNVSITDLNDNAPVFTLPSYTAMVKEDAPTSTSILQVSANDADCGDNGEIEYVLQAGDDDGRFALHPDTGVLTLAKQLDREQVADYLLTVGATDKGAPPNTAVVSVAVTVQDANDNKPVFASNNYSVVVQENRPVGYSIVRLMATDADADPNGPPYTWEIIRGNTANAFTVDQDGTLRLATTRLNHRVHGSFAITVRVWDSGSPPLSADVTVHIAVVEESRYPPTVFPLQVSVITYRTAYAGGHVGKVTALDQDPYDVLQYDIGASGSSEIKYFDIDGQDGTLVALSPLDAGTYPVNITVSDGKYERSVEARVSVKVITEDMVENAVILRVGPLSPEEFLSRYKKPFLRTLRSVLKVKQGAIHVISLQPALLHSTSLLKHNGNSRGKREAEEGEEVEDYDTEDILRDKRGIQKSLDILFAVEKAKNIFLPRDDLVKLLSDSQKQIRDQLEMPLVNVMDSVCGPETDCGGHGTCIDVIQLSEKVAVPLTTQLNSLVAPRFSQTPACSCEQGYAGETCDDLVNACGRRPCAEYEECHPEETTPRGYTCQCPAGYAGPGCKVDLSKCKDLSCHYPTKPLSFKGKSYAQYTVARQAESSSLTVSVFIRTRHPVGTIVYAAGEVDYSILEVLEGYVQYRWDCGSGEGLVRVSAVKVDDQKWHSINLTRDGTIATLVVDGEKSSGAAPGNNDILNLDSNSLFLGAQVRLNQDSSSGTYTHLSLGFVGCLDRVAVGDVELPVAVTGSSAGGPALKRLANVELQCPEELPPPGVCGSQPCQNGGTCVEMKDSYTCSCPPRFTGPQCQIDTAPCASSPCLNGGRCVVVGHNFECKCPTKLSGRRCEYGVYCNPNPCQNGGRCEEGIDGPICKCQHFTGTKCELDIDECTRNPCQNGGTCLNYYGGFRCLCSTNATGEYCTEPLTIPAVTSSSLNMTLEELVCILAVFLACVLAVLVLVAWQRRRWRHKRHQQNNRIKLTDHHVKNDLKANDAPKRNSKICNVEADLQGPPVPPRPASYTPSANDSAILNTLKHLADLSGTGHENLELETLSRCSHEFIHSLTKPVAAPPNLSPPPPSDTDSLHKPWAHHNNLNESYFTPVKASDMGCGLTVRLDDSRTSPSLQSEFTDDTSATSQSKPKVYHWDDYDVRECGAVLTGGGGGGGGGGDGGGGGSDSGEPLGNTAGAASAAATLSTFAPISRNNFSAARKDEEEAEGMPLLPRSSGASPRILSGSGGKPDDPLLSSKRPDVTVKNDGEEEQCSFEEILLANNISLSSDDLTSNLPDHKTRYNIISDLEEEPNMETNSKISNVPGDGDIHNHPLSPGYGNPQQQPTRPHLPDVAPERYGSPRSRRPFQRKDYARVSDVSFLSNLEESTIDPSDPECDLHDSGHNTEDEKCCTDARLDSSLQEYFL